MKNKNRHEKSHDKSHTCGICGKSFGLKQHLSRHEKIHENRNEEALQRHQENENEPPAIIPTVHVQYDCNICAASFENVDLLREHVQSHVVGEEDMEVDDVEEEVQDNIRVEYALRRAMTV